jgi:hypothetical protein
VKNGVITGCHCGSLEADFFGTPYYGHDRMQIPDNAVVSAGDLAAYYNDAWRRKSDLQLMNDGLLDMPEGYVIEGEALRKMTEDEKILAGLLPPPEGRKIEDGKIVLMTLEDKLAAGTVTEEDYLSAKTALAQAELNRRLAELSTEETRAMAEVDQEYAAERKAKMSALLAVKQQDGWPVNVVWPE